jgi:hypothetical protein
MVLSVQRFKVHTIMATRIPLSSVNGGHLIALESFTAPVPGCHFCLSVRINVVLVIGTVRIAPSYPLAQVETIP